MSRRFTSKIRSPIFKPAFAAGEGVHKAIIVKGTLHILDELNADRREEIRIDMIPRITCHAHSVIRKIERHDELPKDIGAEKPIEARIGKQSFVCLRLDPKRDVSGSHTSDVDAGTNASFSPFKPPLDRMPSITDCGCQCMVMCDQACDETLLAFVPVSSSKLIGAPCMESETKSRRSTA